MNWQPIGNTDSNGSLVNDAGKGIVFIDPNLDGLEMILDQIVGKNVLWLDDRSDGVEQITEVLQKYSDLNSIEIISHGKDDFIQLGKSSLHSDNLDRYVSNLQGWGQALDAEGDILFYGCNVAATDVGASLIDRIAALIGADIAASNDLTGNKQLGGDWELEIRTGSIEAKTIEVREYEGVFQFYDNKQYVTTNSLTWEQAQAEAIKLGGNLVTVNDAAEETWLKENFGEQENFWTGFNDREVEGQFEWVSGEAVTYTNWAPEQPNNAYGSQDYGSMNYEGQNQWNDNFSDNCFRGIVEIDPITYKGNQYFVTANNLTWEQAQAEAIKLGGNLVTVNDAAEETWLRENFGEQENFWTGFNDREVEGQFEWVSGEAVTYTNWAPEQPNNAYGSQDYGSMNYEGQNQWNDNFSNNRFRGIVEIAAPTNPIFTYNGNQYLLTSSSFTWDEAQAEAEQKGGTLVTVNDAPEEEWLKQTFGTDKTFWTGFNDREIEGQFQWASGEPVTYTNWAAGEPNNLGGNQDFAVMNFKDTKQWDDLAGDKVRQGIIEIIDPNKPSSITLEQNAYTINEISGNLEIAVFRSGSTQGEATIEYRVDNGTAIAGEDFTATSGTLTFAAGENRQFFNIPILNDSWQESQENFTFVIQSPTGADLGTIRTATVILVDDESNALSFNTPNVTEGDGNISLTVMRGDPNSTASVDFTTIDGTALAGSDYQATSGTVSFAIGEMTKKITIPLLDDSIGEFNETLSVKLSNPVGIVLTNGDTSTITIGDNDPGNFVRETYISGLTQPIAFARTPDDSLMFIAEKSGIIKVAQGTNVLVTPFIDLTQEVNDVRDRGLMSIAVHPDFFNGSPYIYAAYTYDPPEASQNQNPNTDLDDPNGAGNRPCRVVRITADVATNYTTAVAGSQEVILGKNSTWANTSRPDGNSTKDLTIPESGRTPDGGYVQDYIKTDSESHSIGHLAFGEDGALYVSIGDGTSYNKVDPRTASVLTPDSLSGKILRVNPITGEGLDDNPFYEGNLNSNRSKVWNLGLRNPFRFTIQSGSSTPFIGDVGWKTWEEVNLGSKGANFGWSAYEGGVDANGNVVNLIQPEYDAQNIPEIEAFYQSGQTVAAPIYARNHSDGSRAIIMGDFYDGISFPDIYQGALFVTDVSLGTVDALILNDQNQVIDVRRFDSGLPRITFMESGPDDNLYYISLDDGSIGRWRAA